MNKQNSSSKLIFATLILQLFYTAFSGIQLVQVCNSTSFQIFSDNILITCLDRMYGAQGLCNNNFYSYNTTSQLYSCNTCNVNWGILYGGSFSNSPIRQIFVKYQSGIQKTCIPAMFASKNCAEYTYWYTAKLPIPGSSLSYFQMPIYNCSKCNVESGYIDQFQSQILNQLTPDKPYQAFCVLQAPMQGCMKYFASKNDVYEPVYQPLVCLECNNEERFYLANQICNAVNPVCQDFDPTTGNCTSCISGYVLRTNNGDCAAETLNCQSYNLETGLCNLCDCHYLLSTAYECVKINDGCSIYTNEPICSTNCLQCESNYILNPKKQNCILIGRNHCLQYAPDGTCNLCQNSYYLRNHQCTPSSP